MDLPRPETIRQLSRLIQVPVKIEQPRRHINRKHPQFAGVERKDYHRFYMRWWRGWTVNGRRRPEIFYAFRDGMSCDQIALGYKTTIPAVEKIIRENMR